MFHMFTTDTQMLTDTPAQFDERMRKQAAKILRPIVLAAKAAGLACATVQLGHEHPYQAIIDTAAAQRCDLIVMASHARGGAAYGGQHAAGALRRPVARRIGRKTRPHDGEDRIAVRGGQVRGLIAVRRCKLRRTRRPDRELTARGGVDFVQRVQDFVPLGDGVVRHRDEKVKHEIGIGRGLQPVEGQSQIAVRRRFRGAFPPAGGRG